MNNLIADILRALPTGTKVSTTLMVIDYVLCTTTVSPGEEVELLTQIADINQLLGKNWHLVFSNEFVALATQGKVKTKAGDVIDKGIVITHKLLCGKRASLYREKEPSICSIGDSIRGILLTITGQPIVPI